VLLIYAGTLIYDGSLEGLLERFAPYREVKVELKESLTEVGGRRVENGGGRSRTLCAEESLTKLKTYGEVGAVEGCIVRFLIHREELTQTVARILAELDVVDLTVTDPPVEEVIGRVFQAGAVA
jgi:ABC-2 type transport system ATP-binding protein